MKRNCPNSECKFHGKSEHIVRDGYYFRKDDSKYISRYRCMKCGKKFSQATTSVYFRQKKRRVNPKIRTLLCSDVSMRRIARILRINKTTVARKVKFCAMLARKSQKKFLAGLEKKPLVHIQFDDLITKEHTKMKPLTVSLAVGVPTRIILGAEVGMIPAFGHLAEQSRHKYGRRANEHRKTLHRLFKKIKAPIMANAHFESDEHKLYPNILSKYFPASTHSKYKGGRGCVSGQGELKKLNYDPLFYINHTCAMLRANINRLIRKSWCTTKLPEMLQDHLDIYIDYHNQVLLNLK